VGRKALTQSISFCHLEFSVWTHTVWTSVS